MVETSLVESGELFGNDVKHLLVELVAHNCVTGNEPYILLADGAGVDNGVGRVVSVDDCVVGTVLSGAVEVDVATTGRVGAVAIAMNS